MSHSAANFHDMPEMYLDPNEAKRVIHRPQVCRSQCDYNEVKLKGGAVSKTLLQLMMYESSLSKQLGLGMCVCVCVCVMQSEINQITIQDTHTHTHTQGKYRTYFWFVVGRCRNGDVVSYAYRKRRNHDTLDLPPSKNVKIIWEGEYVLILRLWVISSDLCFHLKWF